MMAGTEREDTDTMSAKTTSRPARKRITIDYDHWVELKRAAKLADEPMSDTIDWVMTQMVSEGLHLTGIDDDDA